MKKLNNKGFTVVEILVSFIIVSVIVTSMFNLILSYKNKQQVASICNEIKTYKYNLTKVLEDDFINIGIKSVQIISNTKMNIILNDNTTSVFEVDDRTPSIKYGNENNIMTYSLSGIESLTIKSSSLISSDNYLKIRVIFDHPDASSKYGIIVTSPFNKGN